MSTASKKKGFNKQSAGLNAVTNHETPKEKIQATEETLEAKKWNSQPDVQDINDAKF